MKEQLRKDWPDTVAKSWAVWGPVQLCNFGYVPPHLQVRSTLPFMLSRVQIYREDWPRRLGICTSSSIHALVFAFMLCLAVHGILAENGHRRARGLLIFDLCAYVRERYS